MKKRRELYMTSVEWKDYYRERLPGLWELIQQHPDAISFEKALEISLKKKLADPLLTELQLQAVHCLMDMITQSEIPCLECSEEEVIMCRTLRQLWSGFREDITLNHPDFYHDLYKIFQQASGADYPLFDEPDLRLAMNNWPSGLDPGVTEIRTRNKERIITLLAEDISAQLDGCSSRYKFPPGMSQEQKLATVRNWWKDHRFHLSFAIRSPESLNRYLDFTLSDEVLQTLQVARRKGIPFFVTPYYLSLLNTAPGGYDDRTIREYVIYSPELVDSFGTIKAWEREDVVQEGKGNAAGWLLPDSHTVHRRYPEVAILIPDTMGRACGGLCASCQRMYGFQKGNLNFDLEELKPRQGWVQNLTNTLTYFENDSQLRDILITGGDALMTQNKNLKLILDEVYKMALRKKDTNFYRKEGEKYAELQRVRLGTRLPVYLPSRITDELVEIMRDFRHKGSEAGIRQFIIQTHFQSPLEMTTEAAEGIRKLLSAGWLVTNQLVFTVPASRRGHTAKLRQVLNSNGIICYYTFTVKGFDENKALYTPNCRSVQEQTEEKPFGNMSAPALNQFMEDLKVPATLADSLSKLMQENEIPFVASDRSVMNLPGIGKSMTFRMVGIDEKGRRILAFSHDKTRRHSPVIDDFPEIFIRERKSVGDYLRQVERFGENAEEYASIWKFRNGVTEPRFAVYEYPDSDLKITKEVTNLA
ncbi:MAG: KamA family protein [Bacteroidales bacterium]